MAKVPLEGSVPHVPNATQLAKVATLNATQASAASTLATARTTLATAQAAAAAATTALVNFQNDLSAGTPTSGALDEGQTSKTPTSTQLTQLATLRATLAAAQATLATAVSTLKTALDAYNNAALTSADYDSYVYGGKVKSGTNLDEGTQDAA